MQIVGMLVGNLVHCAEHQSFIGAEGWLFLEYDYRAHYQKDEEGHLPNQFFLVHELKYCLEF
jgi:hypothetical protein